MSRTSTMMLLMFMFTISLPVSGEEPPRINRFVGVDFQLDSEKNGNIIIEMSEQQIALDISKTEQGLTLDLPKTELMPHQAKRFELLDFATNVQAIELFEHGSRVRIKVQISGEFDYQYHIENKQIELIVWPLKADPQTPHVLAAKKKISINFQDVPVRNVLQLIADYNGFNLVASDSVKGNLSLRLDDVPWTDVLEVILQVKGLDKRIHGNVVLVAPLAEIELREQQRFERSRIERERVGFQSQILHINFANARDIAELFSGEGAMGVLSEGGSVRVDERTNSLLVRDFATNIEAISRIVASLDIPVKQVQIEARIVTVSEGSLDELGVRWSLNSYHGDLGGSLEGNFAQRQQANMLPSGKGFGPNDDISDFLNVNLASSASNASTIAFQVAKLGSHTLLDLELSALQRESKAEVISSPRLITTNKQPAYIEQGTEIPYLEAASSGATSVSFKKAVLSLKVTPQITPDDRLILDLSVTQDRPGEVLKTGTGEAVSINTQRIGTQVLVEDGETIVLGGIYQHSVTDTVDKVPLLGDIPLLGALFRRSYQQLGKSELLIFVTPKVVVH
ncbi:type IV pilus secretin PilQ family protein [Vibrio panuliri]